MCDLCRLQTVSKSALGAEDDKVLSFVGSIRRKLIHHNKTASKTKKLEDRVRRAEWRSVENKKIKSEQQLRKDLRDLFEEEIQTFVDRLKQKTGLKALAWGRRNIKQEQSVGPLIVDSLISWAEWFERTKEEAKPGVEKITEDGFETALRRIGTRGPEFTSSQPRVRTTLDAILNQAARTQETFRDVAAESIQRGLSEGDSMADLVRRVASKTQEQVGFRLDRIVQTAGNGAFERGQREAFRKAGINVLGWLSQRDARVRDPTVGDLWSHRSADGQEVKIDQQFELRGTGGRTELLWHPGDPDGSAANVIYCRCTITAVK